MKKIAALISVVLFVFTIVLSAQTDAKAPLNGKGLQMSMRGDCIKALNLTPDQEKQFKEIKYQQQKKAIDLRTQIQKNRLEIKHMMANNNVDAAKLLELTEANSKVHAEIKKSAVQSWLSIYKILKPEQQEMWVKHFGRMGNGMRGNIGNRMMRNKNDRPHMRMQRMNQGDETGINELINDDRFCLIEFDSEDLTGILDPDDDE